MSDEDNQGGLPDQVEAEEARMIVAGGKAKVFDIRSAEEFAEERINGSTRCDPDEVADRFDEDRRDGVLVVCADGERSAEVAESLRSDGVEATSLEGGFGAWIGDHLPTAPNPDEEYEGPTLNQPGAVASSDGEEEQEDEDAGEAETDEQGERTGQRPGETVDEEKAERAEGG